MKLSQREKICQELEMVWWLSKYGDKWISIIEWFEKYYKRNPIKTSKTAFITSGTVCYGADMFKVIILK